MTPFSPPRLAPFAALYACLFLSTAMAGSVTARQIPIDVVAPLLADDGSAYPSVQRMPTAEAAAGGPAPGWATRAQQNQLQQLYPQRVVRLRATSRDPALQRTPAPDAWVFVEGHNEGAVRLARRLADAGIERVWVVLPHRGSQTPAAHVAPGSRP